MQVSFRYELSSIIGSCSHRCLAHQARWASFAVHESTTKSIPRPKKKDITKKAYLNGPLEKDTFQR